MGCLLWILNKVTLQVLPAFLVAYALHIAFELAEQALVVVFHGGSTPRRDCRFTGRFLCPAGLLSLYSTADSSRASFGSSAHDPARPRPGLFVGVPPYTAHPRSIASTN